MQNNTEMWEEATYPTYPSDTIEWLNANRRTVISFLESDCGAFIQLPITIVKRNKIAKLAPVVMCPEDMQ